MKKLLILICPLMTSTAFAAYSVNPDAAHYTCNGKRFTSKTSITTVMNNCKDANMVIHSEPAPGMYANREPGGGAEMTMIQPDTDETLLDKVTFTSDRGSHLTCYYKNNVFVKCKANRKPLSSASGTAGIVKPAASASK